MFPANLRKKALCVGISYKGQYGPYKVPPEDFELAGSHNDVRKIMGLLTELYDYKEQDISVLLDAEGYTTPTKENIISAMNALIDEARPGDNLFVFFAGHADQITNLDGSEYDHLDEIILPLDWRLDERMSIEDRERYSQVIIDDDMNNILVKRLPRGCRLTAVFDSCHSGTILDLPYNRFFGPRSKSPPSKELLISAFTSASPPSSPPPDSPNTETPHDLQSAGLSRTQSYSHILSRVNQKRKLTSPLDLSYHAVNPRGRSDCVWRKGTWYLRGETLDGSVTPISPVEAVQAISWSACSDGQLGYERRGKHENISGGIMVEGFVKILRERPYQTYKEVLEGLSKHVKAACEEINARIPEDEWITQEPQLGSQHKPDMDQLFAP